MRIVPPEMEVLYVKSRPLAKAKTRIATADRVAEDIRLGNRLDIPGTPAVFLDGRLVHHLDTTTLEILIHEELRLRVNGPTAWRWPARRSTAPGAPPSAPPTAVATGNHRAG